VTDPDRIAAVRARYNLSDSPYILSVGTVQPRKNYQMLIRAFQPVAANWPYNLLIVGGKGWLYDDVLAEVTRQGLDGRVFFAGFVNDTDLPALYSGATLFVFPSLYEGFGLPLLEAMGCGAPVITSYASSLPEVAGEGTIQLSPHETAAWTEAINRLLANPAERARMVANGFRQARRFSWQKAARQLLGVYKRLLQPLA
jgi:glycosyltransferase involved in cell wall biosynthesis